MYACRHLFPLSVRRVVPLLVLGACDVLMQHGLDFAGTRAGRPKGALGVAQTALELVVGQKLVCLGMQRARMETHAEHEREVFFRRHGGGSVHVEGMVYGPAIWRV